MENKNEQFNFDLTECPHCGCTKLQKASHLPNGIQRYKCTNCKRRISALTVQKYYNESEIACPHCGSLYNHKMGTDKNGTKRRRCRACGRTFSNKTIVKPKLNLTCIYCGSHDIIRAGKISGSDKRRYYCKSCGFSFSGSTGRTNGGKKMLTDEQLDKIKQDYRDGMQIKELAVKYDRAERTLKEKLKRSNLQKHLEKAKTRLTTQTVRDIIYFGLGARVPVGYLSEYLKVDSDLVEKVLEDYKRRINERN